MQTRSSSILVSDQSSNSTSSTNPNLKGRNRKRSKQRVENSNLEEHSHPVVTMADQRTMAELLHAPTEGYAEAIVVTPILAEHFELKHSIINMMTTDQFFGLEKDNPHDYIRCFNKITLTIKYKDVPNSAIKLMLFPFSLAGAARRWLKKEPSHSIHPWEDLVSQFINEFFPLSRTTNLRNEISNFQQRFDESFHEAWDRYKDLLRTCPHYGFTELHQLDTFYNAYNPADQDSLNAAAGGNLLERSTQDVLTIIENKSKVVIPKANRLLPNGLVIDGPTVPTPPQSINPEEDEHIEETFTDLDLAEYTIKVPPPPQGKDKVQIHKFWQMFKQLHINITLADALILMPKYQKMLKALLSNKEKLQELANTPLNENYTAVIMKKLPEKLGDPGKFLISCGFNELKCKALADLANRAICTPAGIARDVFVPVGKFTFPADFVIVDYESDPTVPLILGRPFLRTARALIDVHGEEMILRDDFLKDLFPYQLSGNPTFSLHPELTSPEVNNDIFNLEGCNVLSEKLLDLYSTKDLHPPPHDNPLNGSTTYFSNPLLEEFADELPPKSSLKDSIDQKNRANLADIFVDSIPEMFTDEHTIDYSSPSILDVYDDDFLEVESDAGNVYDDPFNSQGGKIKDSKLLIDGLDLPCDFHPPSEYDSFISKDFSRVDALPSTNNEDKIFNPGILIQEKPVEIITRVVQDKKLEISNASLVLEDFDPPFYEPLFFKEVPNIPENVKTLAKGFCLQVFIFSASNIESWIRDIRMTRIPLMHNKFSLRRRLVFLDGRRSGNGRSINNKTTASGDGFELTLRVSNGVATERSRP
nr:reverse transcriptase domain-containing protein [Tanacetum cinerariifolium]